MFMRSVGEGCSNILPPYGWLHTGNFTAALTLHAEKYLRKKLFFFSFSFHVSALVNSKLTLPKGM